MWLSWISSLGTADEPPAHHVDHHAGPSVSVFDTVNYKTLELGTAEYKHTFILAFDVPFILCLSFRYAALLIMYVFPRPTVSSVPSCSFVLLICYG